MGLGMLLLIAGILFTILGLLLLFNHGKLITIIFGILFLLIGLGGAKFGYDLDQDVTVEYTVTEITAVTARDDNDNYRITIKDSSGVETWLYITTDDLSRFPQGETIVITKGELKKYRNASS